MAANAQVYQQTALTNATIVTTAETIVATIPSVSVNSYGQIVRAEAMVALTPGTDSTGVVFKWRRNTVTGPQLGSTISYPTTAAVAAVLEAAATAPEPVGLHSYVLTAVVTAASANTTVVAVVATVTVGN